jgi:DNA polymerase
MSPSDAIPVAAAVQQYVRYLQRLGVTELPVVLPTAERQLGEPAAPPLPPVAVPSDAVVVTQEAMPQQPARRVGAAATERLAQLAAQVRTCQKCQLHTSRKQVVFGTGDPAAALVFVGEAPGRDEDIQGRPFVGKSGQLLTRIIEAIGLKREQVYILNVIKCRPPQNRDPLPEEVAACRPIIQAQMACLQPHVICALGAFAAQTLLQSTEKISRLRGRFQRWGDIPVMPTYHPAYLLRNPQDKRLVWQDMQQIQRLLGLK